MTRCLTQSGHADRKKAALLLIQDATERRVGVKPTEGAPVDGAVPGNESGAMTVADHSVIGERGSGTTHAARTDRVVFRAKS